MMVPVDVQADSEIVYVICSREKTHLESLLHIVN